MLPYKAAEDDEEYDFLDEEDDIKDLNESNVDIISSSSTSSNKPQRSKRRDDTDDVVAEDSQEDESLLFNPLSTLLWWNGESFNNILKRNANLLNSNIVNEEIEILTESKDVIEGTWRRLFEVDMRADEMDFSSKALEAEIKELEEEIGELNGIDEDLDDSLSLGSNLSSSFKGTTIGSHISASLLPNEWKNDLQFFQELNVNSELKQSNLKRGKKLEQEEFEKVVREIELEASQSRKRNVDSMNMNEATQVMNEAVQVVNEALNQSTSETVISETVISETVTSESSTNVVVDDNSNNTQ